MSKFVERTAALAIVIIAIALTVLTWQALHRQQVPDTGTTWQSVALINGQLFFGRLEPADGDFVALREVFYVQTRQNPATQAVANILVKRGAEPHQPDRMLINRSQVLLVEPVKTGSPIAKLIAEQQAGR
ncbi:hypothetical protein [Massilia sp. S19_KUP03_FR1]|uniref:hypothetical protein n=1 Tax=Massilia sp. S19_KUP03_FR1 TaxID=3025503 RepID=UPI002FCD8F42